MKEPVDFEAASRADAAGMAADQSLRRHARELIAEADHHNYSYLWRWLGMPVIQCPEDILLLQEGIWLARPTVVVETGVARGGSLVLYASILELIGEGEVVGVDVEIREHNRAAIESHPLSRRITLIEGSSTAPDVVERVRERIPPDARVMVVLDSDHSHDHVLAELRAYGPMVTEGQFLVVADTILEEIPPQAHRPRPWGPGNNPATALDAYLAETDRFERDAWFNNRALLSASRGGYLRCVGP